MKLDKINYPKTNEIFTVLFCSRKMICSGCRKEFRCTGACPQNRWRSDFSEEKPRSACYCEKCLIDSMIEEGYKKRRLRTCYG